VQFIDEDLALVARDGTAASYFTSDQRKEFFAQPASHRATARLQRRLDRAQVPGALRGVPTLGIQEPAAEDAIGRNISLGQEQGNRLR
jgi:hypothetical protein